VTNQKIVAWWLGGFGGAVGAVVVHVLFLVSSSRVEPGPNAIAAERVAAPGQPMHPATSADAEVLRQLAADVGALRSRLIDVPATPAPDRTAATAPAPALDEATLVAALQRVRVIEEHERFAMLSDAELYAEAERLLRAGTMDRLQSRRMLQAVLARPAGSATPELRADTLMLLAQVQRDLRDLPGAAAALQRVVDDLGLGSDRGARAGNRLALLASYTKDWAAGIAMAQRVASEGPVDQAFEARWGIGFLQRVSGDVASARATLQRLIEDCAGRPEVEYVVKMCERQLAEMGQ